MIIPETVLGGTDGGGGELAIPAQNQKFTIDASSATTSGTFTRPSGLGGGTFNVALGALASAVKTSIEGATGNVVSVTGSSTAGYTDFTTGQAWQNGGGSNLTLGNDDDDTTFSSLLSGAACGVYLGAGRVVKYVRIKASGGQIIITGNNSTNFATGRTDLHTYNPAGTWVDVDLSANSTSFSYIWVYAVGGAVSLYEIEVADTSPGTPASGSYAVEVTSPANTDTGTPTTATTGWSTTTTQTGGSGTDGEVTGLDKLNINNLCNPENTAPGTFTQRIPIYDTTTGELKGYIGFDPV